MTPPTDRQRAYVAALCANLRLPSTILDYHCRRRWCVPYAEIDIRQCSDLIAQLESWEAVPADLQVTNGQLSMFGGAV